MAPPRARWPPGSPAGVRRGVRRWPPSTSRPRFGIHARTGNDLDPEEDWAIQLPSQEGVLTQPGFFYDFESEAFLIVSLLTVPEVFREGTARLRRYWTAG